MKKQVYFSGGQGDFRSALLSLAWKVVLGTAICAFLLAGCSRDRNLPEKDSAMGNEKQSKHQMRNMRRQTKHQV